MEPPPIYATDLSKQQLRPAVAAILHRLPENFAPILRARFGIDTALHSIAQIQKQLKVSRLKVREAEARAMRMLLHPAQQELLRSVIAFDQTATKSKVEVQGFVESVRCLTPALIEHLRRNSNDLLSIRWNVFEELLAELLASAGFVDIKLVGRNPNTAADIFAAWRIGPLGSKVKYFVEAKRWKDRVGVEVIDRVYGAMLLERPEHGCHAALVVSAVGFTDFRKYSRTTLQNMGVELADKNDLMRWLQDYRPDPNGLWLPSAPLQPPEDAA